MLASLRKLNPKPVGRAGSRGFTLLEVLTVLFIVGLSASLVAPNLPMLIDRISFALERDTLVRDLNALPYAALEMNRDLVLTGEYKFTEGYWEESEEDKAINIDDLDISTPYRSALIKLAPLNVPVDWEVYIPRPIFYRPSGFCTGGRVLVSVGELEYTLLAEAPYCQFEEADR
ncbi:MAG: Tfp pilus assembly protein FimT/FimU [Rhodospirillaceae bacterium]